jgi:alpha-glucoside transport system permease protein
MAVSAKTMPGAGAQPQRNRERLGGRIFVYGVLLVLTILWVIPTLGLLISSFRSADAVLASGWWTVITHPSQANFTLDNYRIVLGWLGNNPQLQQLAQQTGQNSIQMGQGVVNSLTVAIPATVIPILIAAFAAYGFAWIKFPGRRFFFIVVVALLVVPIQISLIPILRDYVTLQLNGTYLGVWLAHTGFGLPLAIYLLYGYISSLPRDIFESAFIDGATHFTIFTRMILPLAMPALASFAIFQFLWVWNDLLVALVFLGSNPANQVLTMKMLGMLGTFGNNWNVLTAGAFVSMIIPLVVFISLQRYFVRGLLGGSVKG